MSDTLTGLIVILVVIAAAMIWGGHGRGWNRLVWYKKKSNNQKPD
jgi:hypothetical protein